MAMHEQERRRSPPLETAGTASDVPHPQLLLGLGRITGRPAATMATGGGAAGEDEWGPEGAPDNVRSSSPPVAPLSAVSCFRSLLISSPEFQRKSPFKKFQRKPRSHVPRAAPSQMWGFKLPVLPRAPAKKPRRKRTAKKRDNLCAACGATETPLWRTWPTDRRIKLCNACGIRARTSGAVMPELLYLSPPATTATTTTVVAELEQPPPLEIQPVSDSPGAVLPLPVPGQVRVHLPPPATATTMVVPEHEQPPPLKIQPASGSESPPEPDSPIFESLLDANIYLLRRTFPRRGNAPPPPRPPPPPPPPAEPAPAPGNDNDQPQVKCCLHCATTSTRQWRTGPAGEGTLCNPCGVRYRQGRLVPEYRPRASPTFNQAKHSCKHREVLKIRRRQDHPAPAAAYKPIRTRKRRNKGKGQQQPAQLRKKPRKGNKEQDQQPAAQQEAAAVRKKKSKVTAQRLTPQPALLKKRRREHLPPQPPPPALLPHAGDDMVQQQQQQQHLPPPPPAQPHAAGYEMLLHAAASMEMMEEHLLPLLQALPNAGGGDNEMEQHLLPPPPAQLQAGGEGELMTMDEPIPPPDPFLFDGPAAPMIIDDDEPVIVIVIDDD